MDLGQIVVLSIFVAFCFGGYLLVKIANKEVSKETDKNETKK